MNQKKKTRWNFKATEEFVARLMRAAKAIDRPASQIAREAINEKLDELARRFPEIDDTEGDEQSIAA